MARGRRFKMDSDIKTPVGYPAVTIPAKRQLEFNRLMLAFYENGDQKPMNGFTRSCMDARVITIMKEA
jgi:hypothetical protein